MFSCRRALAEPPLRQEYLGRVEVTRVPMYAVRVKGELRPLRYDPAIEDQNLSEFDW